MDVKSFMNTLIDGPIARYLQDNPMGEIVIIGMDSPDRPITIAASGKLEIKDVEKLIKLAAMTSLQR
jgi:hypothetical protein